MDAPELQRLLATMDVQLQLMQPVVPPADLTKLMMRWMLTHLHTECILPLRERLNKQDQFIAAELQSAFASFEPESGDAIDRLSHSRKT